MSEAEAAAGFEPLAAEDPFVWRCGDRHFLLCKAMARIPSLGIRAADILLASSTDLRRWTAPALFSNRTLLPSLQHSNLASGISVVAARLERPFLLFGQDGTPRLGLFALGTKHPRGSGLSDVPETAAAAVEIGRQSAEAYGARTWSI